MATEITRIVYETYLYNEWTVTKAESHSSRIVWITSHGHIWGLNSERNMKHEIKLLNIYFYALIQMNYHIRQKICSNETSFQTQYTCYIWPNVIFFMRSTRCPQLNFYQPSVGNVCFEVSFHHGAFPLKWCQNERDSVSNHQRHDCLLNRLFKAQIKENIKVPRQWPYWGEFTGDR